MTIKKIEIKKEIVTIYLDNNESFNISLECYLNNTILLNDEIDNNRISSLKQSSELEIVKLELLKKISYKKLSKKECVDFLKTYQLDKKEIDKIIQDFSKNYLINDNELAEFIINYYLLKKKGKRVIAEKLVKRGIQIQLLNSLDEYINEDEYKKNINYLLEKYKKMGKNKSNKVLKFYLQEKMMENGYNIEEFAEYLNFESVDEAAIVSKEVKKFFIKNAVDKENIVKITKKLLSKGFNYDIINNAIRECELNETN